MTYKGTSIAWRLVWNVALTGATLQTLACTSNSKGTAAATDAEPPDTSSDDGVTPDPGAADAPDEAGAPQDDTAYFLLTRVNSPEGRRMYASILPDLDHGEVDLGEALELPGLSRVRAYGGKLFAFDGESGVATRYVVGTDGSFSADVLLDGSPARMSFESLGVTAFSNAFAFVSPGQAFYFDTFNSGVVVEWNPETMTITNTFDGNLGRDGFDQINLDRIRILDDRIVLAISWGDSVSAEYVGTQNLLVLDLQDPTRLTMIEDDRCAGTGSIFVEDGYVYALGDAFSSFVGLLNPDEPLVPCLLRWRVGDSTFDPDYELRLDEATTGYKLLSGGVPFDASTLLTTAYVSEQDPTELGLFGALNGNHWQIAQVDRQTGGTTLVDALPPAAGATGSRIIDGQTYFVYSMQNEPARVYRYDGTTAEEMLSVAGDIFRLERLR